MSLVIAEGVTAGMPTPGALPGLTIHLVEPGSPADVAGMQPGDRLLSVNGKRIRDEIDFHFRELEAELDVEYSRDGDKRRVLIQKLPDQELGIKLPALSIRQCRNKCVFCFVDQQPATVRPTLSVKDDDYRYSFLHGNFITMTNVQDAELNRIIEERLSPQYVSVHVTDPLLHQKLLGIPKPDPVVPKLRKLIEGGVIVHTQIVVIPGWNDGDVLRDSVETLLSILPPEGSLSLVPVGLTKHRGSLESLRVPTRVEAEFVIAEHWEWRKKARSKLGEPIVYCADEWFCIAGQEPPTSEYYGAFEQFENGVGMMRKLELDTLKERSRWIKRLPRNVKWTWVTGKSAAPWLATRIAPILMESVSQLQIEVVPVANQFWGEVTTVANLLTGQDIWHTLEERSDLGDLIVLPPDVVNGDRIFLDDWTLDELRAAVVHPHVLPFPGSFAPLLRMMLSTKPR